jgi:Squalene-hopene cyclase C-terminal domain/ER-bound oxygenase mpaB/B'/Rubber oxygenase, catalytic domain
MAHTGSDGEEGVRTGGAGVPREEVASADIVNVAKLKEVMKLNRHLLALKWNERGCWRDGCDAGPAVTAMVAVALKFIGRLDDQQARRINGYLKRSKFQVRGRDAKEGPHGFPPYPGGVYADLGATAACYAGLIATGSNEAEPRVVDAKAYLDANGGEQALIGMARAGDLGALALAMVAKLSTPLPRTPLLFGMAPGSEYLLEQRFGYILPFRCLVSDVLAAYLAEPGSPELRHLPRLTGIPRSAREISDLVIRRFDTAADNAATTAASLTRSGAGVAAGFMKNTARAFVGIAQGGLTAAAGVADSFRLGPLRAFEGAARGVLETGQAVVEGAFRAVSTFDQLRPDVRNVSQRLVRQVEGLRCDVYLHRFRNEDGSWLYGDSVHTALALAAYHALGVPSTDQTICDSVDWLTSDQMMVTTTDQKEAFFNVFYTDIWPTAFALRALLESGTPVDDPAISRAINWLIAVQRSGSWAFQATNNTTPDMDDTAVAMAALAIARDRLRPAPNESVANVDPKFAPREQESLPTKCDAAIQAARVFLLARQNIDGGWASYQPHLPGKPPGAFMKEVPDASKVDGLRSQLNFAVNPPPELGDPATEDVTGRVLFALGRSGLRAADPAVKKAIQFLINQQDKNHGWWGRWVANYVASTAWVLRGLVAVNADLSAQYARNGIEFLLSRRRADGGWRDAIESYRDPSLLPDAGEPSNPCLTGLVLCALIDLGHAHTPEVKQGIDFLLKASEPRVEDTLHTLFPPTLFYTLPQTALQLPLEALGLYWQKAAGPATTRVTAQGMTTAAASDRIRPLIRPLDDQQISKLKDQGDPEADRVIDKIFAEHDGIPSANARIGAIFQTLGSIADVDDVDSRAFNGLSNAAKKEVQQYVTALTPLAVEEDSLNKARSLFERAGFGVPLVLFCSALPQCFAVPYGAKVLMASGRLATNPRRRLVETAQLVFDVLSPDGLTTPSDPNAVNAAVAAGPIRPGRGIRTARRVRLMHAAIRKLVREGGTASDVMPISQFELMGTLMTFSVVVTDGLRALGIPVSEDEANAWFQVWRGVGKVLGIEVPDLVSLETAADGADFFDHIRQDWGFSEEGATLARVTLDLTKELLPGTEFDGIGPTLVRHLAGERCADILGIEPADWTKILIESSPLVSTILGRVVGRVYETPLTPLLQQAAYGTMEALARQEREGKGVLFSISPQILNGWRNRFQTSFRPL